MAANEQTFRRALDQVRYTASMYWPSNHAQYFPHCIPPTQGGIYKASDILTEILSEQRPQPGYFHIRSTPPFWCDPASTIPTRASVAPTRVWTHCSAPTFHSQHGFAPAPAARDANARFHAMDQAWSCGKTEVKTPSHSANSTKQHEENIPFTGENPKRHDLKSLFVQLYKATTGDDLAFGSIANPSVTASVQKGNGKVLYQSNIDGISFPQTSVESIG